MMPLFLEARLRDVPGAPERLLGVLRRQGAAVAGLRLRRSPPSALDLELALDTTDATTDRVEAEVRQLVDVVSVTRVVQPLSVENTDAPDRV